VWHRGAGVERDHVTPSDCCQHCGNRAFQRVPLDEVSPPFVVEPTCVVIRDQFVSDLTGARPVLAPAREVAVRDAVNIVRAKVSTAAEVVVDEQRDAATRQYWAVLPIVTTTS